jgi:hypothetical protein
MNLMQNITKTPFTTLLEAEERDSWFQQERATCHTAETSMALLREPFLRMVNFTGAMPPKIP